ncbi:MAG TPA: hypothetical protein VJN89_04595 [Candidatus Acidoferrum sp.]|nr:hypothetical protein [Candidatus Acidoferrum sp.]
MNPYGNDGHLFTTVCSDTQPATDAGPLLSELRARRDGVLVSAQAADGSQSFAKKLSPGVFQVMVFRGVRYTIYAEQDCGLRWEANTGTPIGNRETERIEVDGSDSRIADVTLSLQDATCKPYQREK